MEGGGDRDLADGLARALDGVDKVTGLAAISGGAMQETWAFDAEGLAGRQALILRRARGNLRADRSWGIDLATEAVLVDLAAKGGVPVPEVIHVLEPGDGLGEGFVMERIDGETIPRVILRDDRFATLRAGLARECGEVLGGIHELPTDGLQRIDHYQPRAFIDQIRSDYESLDAPGAVFELAFRWLRDAMPEDLDTLSLVHGDYRLGNLMVGPDRLRAVLDWEGAHLGDPHEDLGYICLTSWRFGQIDNPVGGFGQREDFYAAYEAATGHAVDPARAHFWEVALTLNWGIQCGHMGRQFLDGTDASVERGAIGRRRSETELDLLRLIDGRSGHAR